MTLLRLLGFTTRLSAYACLGFIGACATKPAVSPASSLNEAPVEMMLNRITWGASSSSYADIQAMGVSRYLARQLEPKNDDLPEAVQSQINAMTITQYPMEQLVIDLEQRRRQADPIINDDEKKSAQQAYQNELNRLAREAAARSLLRDIYSRNQLREQLTWFWMNHFNVHQGKQNLRAMIGDYEDHAIRQHALGKFRDLLAATLYHPAMLRYLDNERNAVGHINENYARELMELHTLGVDAGYTQKDVQELARVLTGLGLNMGRMDSAPPKVKKELQAQYVRRGLFEFNPNRHDYGNKQLFGRTIRGRGLAEVDEVLDLLCRHPATARFVSRKLAVFFVGDDPPATLVDLMAARFRETDGDIASTLLAMFNAPEFRQSLGREFKDPAHYVVSAVRLAYDVKPILNPKPMLGWLNRLGEPLYGRQSPDGYPISAAAWSSSGQMTARFDIAQAIGSGSAGLFKSEGMQQQERPAFPRIANAYYFNVLENSLSASTRHALEQADSPQEWNVLFLSSPEFMHR